MGESRLRTILVTDLDVFGNRPPLSEVVSSVDGERMVNGDIC